MAYRAMYCYAWDLAEAGVATAIDNLRRRHINTITLAGSYHAGKFIRPQGRGGKVYFPEDGTAYFKTDRRRYRKIKPVENSLLPDIDVFEECCKHDGVSVNAWMVLLHNSLQGQQHQDSCVTNAFGDRYIYNLCPSAPEVRDYAVALCSDVTERYPVMGLSLESPGFLPFEHGYHHEFALVRQNLWLNNMLGLCFCPHCMDGAKSSGIDIERLKSKIANSVSTYLSSEVDYADDMAQSFWVADVVTDPDLAAFLRWRCDVVTALIAEIRTAIRTDAALAVIPSVARPSSGAWYEGSDLAALSKTADCLEICFYEPDVGRIRSDLHDVIQRCGGSGKIRGLLRPAFPDLSDEDSVIAAVRTLIDAGVGDVAFYNYGHLRKSSLEWVEAALRNIGPGA